MLSRYFEKLPGVNRYAFCLQCLTKRSERCEHGGSPGPIVAEGWREAVVKLVLGQMEVK
jgi:hypothetical protein